MMTINLVACGAGSVKWEEEVQLSNGRIIVLERETIYEGGGDEWAFNRRGSKIKEYRMRFTHPAGSGKMIEWHSKKIDFQTYPEVPLVFDIPSGQPTIFSLVAISSGCEVYSKYVYQHGTWTEETLPAQFEQHITNLVFASKKDLPKLLNLTEKNKRNEAIWHRSALKSAGPNLKICG
jgi:hypothetical protein